MRDLLARIDTATGHLNNLLISIVAVIIALITVLLPLNLLIVKMQWGSIWWLHESVEYALYIGVFIGAPWVLRRGAHIKADVIAGNLPPSLGIPLDKMINILGFGICLTLFVYGFRGMLIEYQDGTYPPKDLRIANWYMLAIFCFTFLLLALEFLLRLFRPEGNDRAHPETVGM